MSCLVIKNDGIGDLILSSGIIAGLAKYYNGNLDLVTCEQNREIAEMIPDIQRVFYVSRDGLKFSKAWWKYGVLVNCGTREDGAVLAQLQSSHYDAAISLRRFIRQNTLAIMRKVNASKKLCAWQYPTNATKMQATRASKGWQHYEGPFDVLWEPEYYQGLIENCLQQKIDCRPDLQLPGVDHVDCDTSDSIAVGVARSDLRWPSDYWLRLVRGLAESGYDIGLFGGADSVETCAQIVNEVSGVSDFSGRYGFVDTASKLRRYSLFLGYDSSLSHFASLVCPKVVVIYGGGTFRRFFPWNNQKNQHLIYYGMDCFDCDWECKYAKRECLIKVTPESVVGFVNDVYAGKLIRELDLNPRNETYTVGWRRSKSVVRRKIRNCDN